jgi:hypothetical protein
MTESEVKAGHRESWLEEGSGQIRFDDLTVALGPDLALSELLAHADAARFSPFISNPPHRSFQWSGRLDGTAFGGVAFFEGERLTHISLTIDDPKVIGTSWSDYDAERARSAHDQWLQDRLGAGGWSLDVVYEFAWGQIGSFLHPQDGTASITVTYTAD